MWIPGNWFIDKGLESTTSTFLRVEQGGILAFLLFIAFLVVAFKQLYKVAFRTPVPEDRAFAFGMGIYFAVLMLIGWGGQIFWRGFGTENFNTYIVMLLVIATRQTSPVGNGRPR